MSLVFGEKTLNSRNFRHRTDNDKDTWYWDLSSNVLKMKARSRGRVVDQRKSVLQVGVEIIEPTEPLQ